MRRFLYFTVFISGMTAMAAEFGASRLLGNVYGTSTPVWAVIIGLILVYLTAGYFIGGRWADRSPHARTLFTLLAWGAFSLGLIPLVARPVLRMAANAFDSLQVGLLVGAFAGVILLLTVPVTLFGMVSPFAIRILLKNSSHAGKVSGMVYGISTLGSFLGTFLPTLVLIPTIGTNLTFLVFSVLLLCVALIGLLLTAGRKVFFMYLLMLVALVVAGFFNLGWIKRSPGQIYESESAYNYIQVLEIDGTRYLRLNEGQGMHSQYRPDTLEYGGPWQQFLVGPFFNPGRQPEDVKRIAIVGLAAGTTARQAVAVFPNVVIDGIEIDARIVDVGRRYFDMNLPNLNVIIQDGRWGLESSREKYNLICVDAYRPPYIPPHLTTREFFQVVAQHLVPQGAVAVNVGRSPGDRRLINGLATTLRTSFASIYVMDIPQTFNSMLIATLQPTSLSDLESNYTSLINRPGTPALLTDSIDLMIKNIQPEPEITRVFTDDKSPIEWITNTMIINFFLEGQVEDLQ